MQDACSQADLDAVLASTPRRTGWDFSRMNVLREPVPWDYEEVVARYARPDGEALDVGTGGGDLFGRLAGLFGGGLGIDTDPEMIGLARRSCRAANLQFAVAQRTAPGHPGLVLAHLVQARALRPGCGRPAFAAWRLLRDPASW
jgi:SAM-dependent methyltransferase